MIEEEDKLKREAQKYEAQIQLIRENMGLSQEEKEILLMKIILEYLRD